MTGKTQWNRKGQFENHAIREDLVKPFLRSMGADPMGQKPLPDIIECIGKATQTAPTFRRFIQGVMDEQGYTGGPWFYKGAKMAIVWPIWHEAFPDAKWIIVRRHPNDIAASCLRTAFMRAYKTEAGWLSWVAEHERRFFEMHAAGLKAREIWSQKIIEGNLDWIKGAVEWAGLKWNEEAVRAFVDPGLWGKRES
jgi:hypothetical protein